MTARFLLDTNVLAEPLRPVPHRGILAGLRRHSTEMVTAAPVWHEMLFGFHRLPRSKKRTEIGRYLLEVVRATLAILPYDTAAADWHAVERARLARLGRPPAFVDGQIAAIARVNALVLVTANVADFAAFEGLDVEDWRSQ